MSARRTSAQSAATRHGTARARRAGASRIRILEEFRVLAPSTNTTMTALLYERGQLRNRCLGASLATPGASMREPSKAIDAGRSVDDTD